jgi:hypothetical protein
MRIVNTQIKADFEKLGYKVDLKRLPSTMVDRNGQRFGIPEREVLQLSAGTANDSLSRELLRTEKWDSVRRAEYDFPSEIKPLRVIVDPVDALTSDAYASFKASTAGPTIQMTPQALLSLKGSGEEAFRHELRHLKAYYDVVSGKPTPYRGSLIAYGTKNLPSESLGAYQRYFSFDELEGFMSNLKETGAKVGREKENLRTTASSKVDISQHVKSYNEKMAELRVTANNHYRQINGFADSIESGVQSARMKIEVARSEKQFQDLINIKPEFSNYPGHRAVEIDLSPAGTRDGTRLEVLIPLSNVKIKKPEEIRNYIIKYLDDLEDQTKKMRTEAERRKILIRADAVRIN